MNPWSSDDIGGGGVISTEYESSLIRAIYEASPAGILVVDDKGIIVSHNRRFIEMSGIPRNLLQGPDPGSAIGLNDAPIFASILARVKDKPALIARIRELHGNPEMYDSAEVEFTDGMTVEWQTTALRGADGLPLGRVWFFRDISAKKKQDESIITLGLYDVLTGLPNRRLLVDRMGQALATSTRTGREGALLFIDLDNFKDINDTAGHDIGDLLLQQTAQRLKSCVRACDTVARIGGDEFVVMLEELSKKPVEAAAETQLIGDKILATLGRPYLLAEHNHRGTASIGATIFSNHGHSREELLKRADIAMYQAKKAGRNTLRFFNPVMQDVINTRIALETELRKALESHQFELYYQVQVDDANRPVGAEALIRWLHPEHGLVSPAQFIPLAEDTGLILPIGEWVLETACAQIKAWEHNALTRDLSLAVNVSAKQFRPPDFVSQVQAIIQRHAINPARLKLELTESALVGNIEEAIATMAALQAVGVHFTLDDFGTGYSSLQYLKRLPVDQLKIDQSFVHDLVANKSDRAIVRTIIAMAKGLDLDVIAEGVETEAERQLLQDMGCARYQGYLFGKPVPIAQFEAMLTPARLPVNPPVPGAIAILHAGNHRRRRQTIPANR